jgi:hypothetical protein
MGIIAKRNKFRFSTTDEGSYNTKLLLLIHW